MHSGKRELIEGALLSALSFILFSTYIIPVLGGFTSLLSSLPILITAFRSNLKTATLCLLVSTLLVSQFLTIYMGIVFFSFYGTGGLIIGFLLRFKLNPSRVILAATFLSLIIFVLTLFIMTSSFGVEFPVSQLQDRFLSGIDEVKNSTIAALKQQNTAEADRKIILYESSFENIRLYVRIFMPSLFVFASACFAAFYYFLGQLALKFYVGARVEPISSFALPWKFVLFVLAGLLLVMFHRTGNGPDTGSRTLLDIALNILVTGVIFYFFQGIAVIGGAMERNSIPFSLVMLVFLFACVFPPLLLLLAFLGIMDSWINVRKYFGGTNNESHPA
ncbi:MAG: DUF2232 domain-containing protein [Candidatus Wallbacteria bacterium]|nr:DUF2232 domain-containing protein [Candidatus Wallbacteria bacterium]